MSLSAAVRIADTTSASRNRVVDLLRAGAIVVVALGHWLMAAVYVDATGRLHRGDMLHIDPWAHPLTWALQVMPVFFIVGGYANALSWRRAVAHRTPYGGWLRARLRRLTLPVLPLMLFWLVVGPACQALGVSDRALRIASRASLVPTWFLVAYALVVTVAPAAWWLWERYGWWSVAAPIATAALLDLVSISTDAPSVAYANFLLVWGAVHQLGFAWVDGAVGGTVARLLLAGLGLLVLVVLVTAGPYSVSMVGVEGHGVNNAYPTRVTLAFLGVMQGGVVMALEPLLARVTARRRVWVGTVLTNAQIMTLYLWHMTALSILIAGSLVLGGAGLGLPPNSAEWWLTRPLWWLVLGLLTTVLVALLGRFEQPGPDDRPAPHPLRPVLGMLAIGLGVGALAQFGIIGRDGTLHWWLPLVPLAASVVFGIARPPWQRSPQTASAS